MIPESRCIRRLGQVQEELPVSLSPFFFAHIVVFVAVHGKLLHLEITLVLCVSRSLLLRRGPQVPYGVEKVRGEKYPALSLAVARSHNVHSRYSHHDNDYSEGRSRLHAIPMIARRSIATSFADIPRQAGRWFFQIGHIGS